MISPQPNTASNKKICSFYQERIDDLQSRLEALECQSVWMSRLRGLTFFPALVLAVCGWSTTEDSWPWYAGAAILFAGFIALCTVHETLLQQASEIKHRRTMNRVQLARVRRRWNDVPEVAVDVPREHQAVSRDLDLFGHSSVFQLVSLAHTSFGRETMRNWLLEPATKADIVARQEAVSVLAPNVSFREELDLRGRILGIGNIGPMAFVQWAEATPWLTQRSWLKWLTRLLSVAAISALVVALSGWLDALIAWLAFLAIVVMNLAVNIVFVGKVYEIFNSVSSRNHDIQHYRPLFEAIAELPQRCVFLTSLQSKMGKTPQEPIWLLKRLTRILRFANLRRDGLIGVLYFFSQMIILTDFHLLCLLETWQHSHGRVVRDWLESVGQLEAISSLATLAHDHPDWVLPAMLDSSETRIEAKDLGHPLLADEDCVYNDVEVGPSGTFLLVTGSNMSGKSTLLRAIGVNVALAQAGGPVRASEFRLPPLQLATSMRIDDSLADGLSFFMAELKRLKQIVGQCRGDKNPANRLVLYKPSARRSWSAAACEHQA